MTKQAMSTPANRPFHLVYLLQSLGGGGMENGVVNLLNRMDPARFRVTLALMEPECRLADRIRRPGTTVVQIPRKRGRDPLYPLRLARAFRELAPDLVHTRGFSSIDGLLGAKLAGVPAIVHTEHGRDVDEADRMRLRRRVLRTALFRFADRVGTVSQELQDCLVANVRVEPEKLRCLPNGVDLSRFDGRRRHGRVRSALAVADDTVVLVSVGRHDPVKDYPSLLHAFAPVAAEHRAELWLLGQGPDTQRLATLATELGVADRVRFLGFRDDVPDVLLDADAFVLPSVTEGMSNALLEAMACGLPAIATRVGGNPELVVDRVTGALVPVGDVGSLTAELERVVGQPRTRQLWGTAARKRVEEVFSLEKMVRRYEELYLELLGEEATHASAPGRAGRAATAPPEHLAAGPVRTR